MVAFLDLIDKEEDKLKFQEIYDQYLSLVLYIVNQKLSSHEDVEECVQDVFLHIAQNMEKIEEVDSPKTKCFISVISEGKAVDKFRSFARLSAREEELSDDEIAIEDFDEFDCTELKMVIDSLDEKHKNFLYLTYIFGYTSKEIAKMYNMSDAKVRKIIQFAKQEVKYRIKNWD